MRQKSHLFGALAAVGIAHAHGHLVGELALPVVGEGLRRTGQGEALEQDILVQGGEFGATGFTGQRGRDAANFLALGLGFFAIGKGGKQRNGQQGFLIRGVHGFKGWWVRVG